MTIYYSLVFALLMAEMAVFLLLIVPLPFNVRRKVFTFLAENPVVAKIQYGLKISFIFILILFVDSANRVFRVQAELSAATAPGNNGAAAILGHERLEVQNRKFYSQRNMYLCGFTLFLSLILHRTYIMIVDILRLEEKVKIYESSGAGKKSSTADAAEAAKLRKELASKDTDLQTLKKQAEALQREYNELSDKYTATQGSSGSKKTN